MAAPKLTKREQASVLAWLCEGCVTAVVIERLQTQFGKALSRQAVDHYRAKWSSEIDAAEAEAFEVAKRSGWGRKTKRVGSLCCVLDKCEAAMEGSNAGPLIRAGVFKELRETLAELRKELGQEQPTKVAIDGDFTHNVRLDPEGLEDALRGMAAVAARRPA
jgi:hypothetical protein